MPSKLTVLVLLSAVLNLISPASSAVSINPLFKPLTGLTADDLAVIVNDSDPLSLDIADYYQRARRIPDDNIIHVRFRVSGNSMSAHEFSSLRRQIESRTPKHVQAYALTWRKPFKVDCMSITTAFAAGYDEAFCAKGCVETRKSPYYASSISKPYTDLQWRPTMVLAGETFEDVKQLIDRGVAADYSLPKGSAYLLKTHDVQRSSRAAAFAEIAQKFSRFWPVYYLEQDSIAGKTDVMFYFTGLVRVLDIDKNTYLPGAVADHLTSTGGILTGETDQMNSLDWLKAGATASYGAVVEPCNYPAKFPNPAVLMYFYFRGSSLIEAYWKSVAEPGQGIFIGEPLAKPFAYKSKEPGR